VQKKGGGGADNTADLPRVFVGAEELGGDGKPVIDLFIALGMASSKADARRLIKGGGARIDGEKIADEALLVTAAAFEGAPEIRLSAGKKRHGIVELTK
jgi:tyrosyl-tRNA synthetase